MKSDGKAGINFGVALYNRLIMQIAWFVFAGYAAFGQAPEPKPTFEVASVKPAGPLPNGGGRSGSGTPLGMRGGPGTPTPGQINYTYVTLKQVLLAAYGVKNYQISGPAWLDEERAIIYLTFQAFGSILETWKRQTLSGTRLSGSPSLNIAVSS
jgi:hypothetical protein